MTRMSSEVQDLTPMLYELTQRGLKWLQTSRACKFDITLTDVRRMYRPKNSMVLEHAREDTTVADILSQRNAAVLYSR